MPKSSPKNSHKITDILNNWQSGDFESEQKELSPILYETMRRLSHRYISQEKHGYTLQTTDLVHEAYEVLVDADIDWKNRRHFYAIAAKTIRRLLIDRARKKNALKRGGDFRRITFDEVSLSNDAEGDDILLLDESLKKLKLQDERKANIIELYFYAGLTYQEIALYMNISEATVDRDLRFSKAWLASEMEI